MRSAPKAEDDFQLIKVADGVYAAIAKPVVRPATLMKLEDKPLVQTYRSESRREMIDFAVPLVFSQVPVGALYVGFSKEAIGALFPGDAFTPAPRRVPGVRRTRIVLARRAPRGRDRR